MAVVETERHGQILVVRMNQPERLNALNHEIIPVEEGSDPPLSGSKTRKSGETANCGGSSALERIERREAVAVFRVVPALEPGRTLFGKGRPRLDQVALGAVLAQGGG